LGVLDSGAYWEFELLMFQLFDFQGLAVVMVVEITAG